MLPQWVIEKKRDGQALDAREIRWFIDGYATGRIPDYQMAALAMAIYLRGMTFDEIAVLTDAMLRSGEVLDLAALPLPKADKHSTGGIGDKVSLILAPLVACCGVAVPMLSGRGLGITGGTLDKLESIPGYRTNLSAAEFTETLRACGASITGQTGQLAPADKKLYALRDVTGTVPSIPLISASIMSKKLAEGAEHLVLDVKFGTGAFMKSIDQARELARTMVEVGRRMGRGMAALLTDMSQPLGRTAGNALEIVETIDCLRGKGPADLMEVTLELSARMLLLAGVATSRAQAVARLQAALDSGAALERFRQMVRLQGGDVRVIDEPARLPAARIRHPVTAPTGGYVARMDAEGIGRACVVLGAGRQKVEDPVDFAVGISDIAKEGEPVRAGQPLMVLHANDEQRLKQALELAVPAATVGEQRPSLRPLVAELIGG